MQTPKLWDTAYNNQSINTNLHNYFNLCYFMHLNGNYAEGLLVLYVFNFFHGKVKECKH